MNRLSDIIYSWFVMVCITLFLIFVSYTCYNPVENTSPPEQLIEIKKVE